MDISEVMAVTAFNESGGSGGGGGGGINPTGTINITENGTYNVRDYASANVETPVPSGTVTIVSNGEYDVTEYATVDVETPVPSGSIRLGGNGTFDVSQYAEAVVNVPKTNPLYGSFTVVNNSSQTIVVRRAAWINATKKLEHSSLDIGASTSQSVQTIDREYVTIAYYTASPVAFSITPLATFPDELNPQDRTEALFNILNGGTITVTNA